MPERKGLPYEQGGSRVGKKTDKGREREVLKEG